MTSNDFLLNRLRFIIGDELFKAVCDDMVGERIYIKPYTIYQSFAERNKHIREDFYSGATFPELVEKYKLQEHHIRKIINDRKAAE